MAPLQFPVLDKGRLEGIREGRGGWLSIECDFAIADSAPPLLLLSSCSSGNLSLSQVETAESS